MPTPEMIASFREGTSILKQVHDFATLQKTIDRMVSNLPPEELPLAKDAIARVLQNKQAYEVKTYQNYPNKLEQLEIKYRDLYAVLKNAKSLVAPRPAALPNSSSNAPQGNHNAMQKAPNPLGGFGMTQTVINWLKDKKKYIMAGGAVGVAGGAYFLYKQLNKEPEKKNEDSSFDKTIKSIQKYRAFTQMMKNPDFSGDYQEMLNGGIPAKKKKIKKKKESRKDALKSSEWESDEQSLMKDMDKAFNSISTKPNLNYALPQLPAPKTIDPRDVIGDDRPLELTISESGISSRGAPEQPKKRKKRRSKEPKTAEVVEVVPVKETPEPAPARESSSEKKPKKRKVKKAAASSDDSPGLLIPIVKRTKRVKKVNA